MFTKPSLQLICETLKNFFAHCAHEASKMTKFLDKLQNFSSNFRLNFSNTDTIISNLQVQICFVENIKQEYNER